MERLEQQKILEYLNLSGDSWPGAIHLFAQLESTNSWLLEHGCCGDCCLADRQTKGRGRRGNHWVSPANGNIYLSFRCCFDAPPHWLSLTSLLAGIGLCQALYKLGLRGHGLKWPNDILVGGKKLAGVLVETTDRLQTLVIGIGLNVHAVHASHCRYKSTSLQQLMQDVPDRNLLVAQLLRELSDILHEADRLDFAGIRQRWQHWDCVTGREVVVVQGAERHTGVVQGIDAQGQLLLKQQNGKVSAYSSAEITLGRF